MVLSKTTKYLSFLHRWSVCAFVTTTSQCSKVWRIFFPHLPILWSGGSIPPTDRKNIKTVGCLRTWKQFQFVRRIRSCVKKKGGGGGGVEIEPSYSSSSFLCIKYAGSALCMPQSFLVDGRTPLAAERLWLEGWTLHPLCPRVPQQGDAFPSIWWWYCQSHRCPFGPCCLWNASLY